MITDKLIILGKLKARAEKLEKQIAAQRVMELAALPGTYGYDTVAAFVKAVKSATGAKKGKKRRAKVVKAKKRKRAKVTPEIKAGVVEAVKAGKTGAEIAKQFKVSLPTVQNIKKAAGLVKNK